MDPNQVGRNGKTSAQIDADQARYVAAANDALASLHECGCRWSAYSMSHHTFEVVVGDPLGRGNLVLWLEECDRISGPVAWQNQRLRVIWDNNRDRKPAWVFTLQDDSVGFKATGCVFWWRRDYDLQKSSSRACPRADDNKEMGSDPPAR